MEQKGNVQIRVFNLDKRHIVPQTIGTPTHKVSVIFERAVQATTICDADIVARRKAYEALRLSVGNKTERRQARAIVHMLKKHYGIDAYDLIIH